MNAPTNEQPGPFEGPWPARVSRHATLWRWEQGRITEGEGPHVRFFWERLNTDLGLEAQPHCCLLDTVQFLAPGREFRELGRCKHYNFTGLSPHLLGDMRDGLTWWEVASGQCRYEDGHWWMVWRCYDNTNAARMMNLGWEAARR